MTRYLEVVEGEWYSVRRNGERHMCCHCGLVHSVDHRLIPWTKRPKPQGIKIEMRWRIDEKATAAARKSGKYRQQLRSTD